MKYPIGTTRKIRAGGKSLITTISAITPTRATRAPCRPTRQIAPGPSVRLICRTYLGQHFAQMGRSFIEKYFSRMGARQSEHDMKSALLGAEASGSIMIFPQVVTCD